MTWCCIWRQDQDIPWIFILVPRASNLGVLLIDLQAKVAEVPLQLVGHKEARSTGADADDADVPLAVDGAC